MSEARRTFVSMYDADATADPSAFDPDRFIDACDVIDGDMEVFARGPWSPSSEESFAAGLSELEGAVVRSRILVADQYCIMSEVLEMAAEDPEPWVGPDPTLDRDWFDPRGRSVGSIRRTRREIAIRAAAADIAVRLRMAEGTVHARAANAGTLKQRCPRVWEGFLSGRIAEANAVTAAQLAGTLPEDAREACDAFDAQAAGPAESLTAGKFRIRARVIRERLHPESVEARHSRATEDRRVWVTPELEGMATFGAFMPAVDAHAVLARVSAAARHLSSCEGETRSIAQLRADALADLIVHGEAPDELARPDTADLAGGLGAENSGDSAGECAAHGTDEDPGAPSAGSRPPVGPRPGAVASVAITIPALTLLGHGDEPAMLEGYGPIDLDTARRLAGGATSWIRVLTHPVTGTVLDVDRRAYRVPEALRRWLGVRHPVCIFPGCRRPSAECDIDHSIDWQYGGRTRDENLAPLCRSHHTVKHESLWAMTRDPVTGDIAWTSPTGYTASADPPPF